MNILSGTEIQMTSLSDTMLPILMCSLLRTFLTGHEQFMCHEQQGIRSCLVTFFTVSDSGGFLESAPEWELGFESQCYGSFLPKS